MPAAYTDAAAVAAALRLSPDTTLAAPVSVGDQSISISANQVAGDSGIYPGMYLALDHFNLQTREVVQVTDAVTGVGPYTVPVTATVNAHVNGSPVKEVSALQDVVDAGSRLWDDACFTKPGAFAEQTWTETLVGQGTSDGRLFLLGSGRNITAVTSLQWQANPSGSVFALDPTQCTFDDYQLWAWAPQALPWPFNKNVYVTVTYTAGYNPLPGDIVRASTVLAARLYKEGDSGFSDVTANTDLGMLQYKKGIPGDIALMAKRWRRWT